jgi:hypothetical protein
MTTDVVPADMVGKDDMVFSGMHNSDHEDGDDQGDQRDVGDGHFFELCESSELEIE